MNVILVSLDTLRARSMSVYGYPRPTTPHLERLAANGTVFEHCFSPHIPTHPGHTGMMTGMDVFATHVLCQGGKVDLDPGIRMLAEILRDRGYFTAAADNLGRWFSRGFSEYRGYRWESDPARPYRKAEAVNEVSLGLLNQAAAQDQPFFLFLHYWDAHTPYKPPEPFKHMFYTKGAECDPAGTSMGPVYDCAPFSAYFRQWMFESVRDSDQETRRLWTDRDYAIAQYDAAIAYLDATLEQLWSRMAELNLFEDTMLVVTADHGEELDEHALWFDHHGLYDTNLWVPLIVVSPGRVPAGKRVQGMVRLYDIPATILDVLDMPDAVRGERMVGRSLRPLFKRSPNNRKGITDSIYLTECTWMRRRGLRTPQWKLIVEVGGTPEVYGRPDLELYDLEADPHELHNVAHQFPEVVRELNDRLEDRLRERTARTRRPDPFDYQDITLRQVGSLEAAIPRDQRLVDG